MRILERLRSIVREAFWAVDLDSGALRCFRGFRVWGLGV